MSPISKQTEDFNARSPEKFGSARINPIQTRELKPGDMVNSYKILRPVGHGAMGRVYEVEQIYLHRRFALKTLHPIAQSDISLRRFQQEAQAASRLDHPNLVRAVDFGMIDETQPFLVMDFFEGLTLSDYLKTHACMPPEEALKIFIPICFALAYAHGEGVIHRDIKPSNIVLANSATEVVPKLVDFGIAKIDQTEGLTKTGEVFGTPLYMSPEQCTGINVDHRTDIYALGCVLYEVLTGTPPLRGESALETMMQHSTTPVPPMKQASLGLEIPAPLESIVLRMLAKEPDMRYQDFLKVADDLVAFQHGNPISAPAPSRPQAAVKTLPQELRLGKFEFGLLMLLGCAIIAGAIVAICYALTPQNLEQKQAHVAESISFPNIDMIGNTAVELPEHFSRIENRSRIFSFPAVHSIGTLSWYQGMKRYSVDDLNGKTVTVPVDARYISFEPNGDSVLLGAKVASRFQDGDLEGLIWKPGSDTVAVEPARKALEAYTNVRTLRMILIRDVISQKALENVGKLPNLRWLIIDQPGQLIEDQPDKGEVGAFLAQLPNLHNLTVFGARRILNIGPLVQQLGKDKSLLRLQLKDVDLTRADLAAVTQMKQLKVLDLSTNEAQPSLAERLWLLNKLAQMPHLKKLSIDEKFIGVDRDGNASPPALQALKQLRNLSCFAVIPPSQGDRGASAQQKTLTPATRKRIKESLSPNCQFGVERELYADPTVNWFWLDIPQDLSLLQ